MSKAKILWVPTLLLICVALGSPLHASALKPQPIVAAATLAFSAQQEPQRPTGGLTTEKAEEDPGAAFRRSAAVKWVARTTGLGEPGAFWLCMALNFLVIFGILWYLLRKIIPATFRNRTEAIQRRLEEARKTSEEARQRLAGVEERLSRLDVEIEQMRREAEASGLQEEERVMAAAEEERRRIVESAEQEIARAANAARRELKAYAAELGVSLAEKKIRIEASMDQKLVRDFTVQLGRDDN
jgi:F-type H+-transporting ATPase subunit b